MKQRTIKRSKDLLRLERIANHLANLSTSEEKPAEMADMARKVRQNMYDREYKAQKI